MFQTMMTATSRTLTLSLLTVAATIGCAAAGDERIRIAGSDFLAANTAPALIAEAEKTGVALDLDLAGSVLALGQLNAGEIDAALVLDAGMSAMELPEGIETITLGHAAAVVLINPLNPIDSISTDQLEAICGAGLSQVLRRWGDVGLEGIWAGRAIVPALVPGTNNVVRDLFQHHALAGRGLAGVVVPINNTAEALVRLGREVSMMLILGIAEVPEGMNGLSVGRGDGAPVAPTAENIADESYPLILPLRLAFHRENRAGADALAALAESETVQNAILADGFLPVRRE